MLTSSYDFNSAMRCSAALVSAVSSNESACNAIFNAQAVLASYYELNSSMRCSAALASTVNSHASAWFALQMKAMLASSCNGTRQ